MSPPSLGLADVTKNFGPTEIIRGVSMNVAAGERHALIGPNGAGKTTLVQPDQRPISDNIWRNPTG